jgi:hypothetical protein
VKALRLSEGAPPILMVAGETGGRGERAPSGSEIGPQLNCAKLRVDRFFEPTGDEMAEPDRREISGLRVVSRAQTGGQGKFVEAVSGHAAVGICGADDNVSER